MGIKIARRLPVLMACCAVLMTASPASGLDCPEPPFDPAEVCVTRPPTPDPGNVVHPPMMDIIHQAIQNVTEEFGTQDADAAGNPIVPPRDCGVTPATENIRMGGDCEENCWAGLVIEEVARLVPDAGLLYKPGGFGCNGHGFDQLIFDDGYMYDVIGGAGASNSPQWMSHCCGPVDGNGTCLERYVDF